MVMEIYWCECNQNESIYIIFHLNCSSIISNSHKFFDCFESNYCMYVWADKTPVMHMCRLQEEQCIKSFVSSLSLSTKYSYKVHENRTWESRYNPTFGTVLNQDWASFEYK